MSVKKEVICRLCLKDAIDEFEEIDEAMEQMFDILSLKLDLKISKDPLICQDCLGVATKCLSFKSTCIDTEELILSYFTDVEQVKHNIKAIYKQWKHVETAVEDLIICRLCMTQLEKNNFVCLDDIMNENMFEMLSEYIPEMDFNIIENPIICTTCRENLQGYSKFTLDCLDIEEKIKAYCREEGTDGMDQVKLGNILHFLYKYPVEYTEKCAVKKELTTFEDTENVYLEAYSGFIKPEELDIKKEEINLQENRYETRNYENEKCDDRIYPKGYGTETQLNNIFSKTKEDSIKECTYQKKVQANIKENCSFHEDILEVKRNRETSDQRILKNYMSICKGALEPKQKNKINRHVLIQNDPLNLQGSLSVRKDIFGIRMYKCSFCAYETKYKCNLTTHMLVHKDPSEIKMYKCSFCAYETKQRCNLKTHFLVHKDPSEIKMYKCSFCAYEAKHKASLKTHLLVHKDSEIKTYKCLHCAYEAKQKGNLKTHMLVHDDPSKIKMYKCLQCAYEAKQKCNLKTHLLVHKDPSEIKMYKCSFCAYEAKHKASLKTHLLVHEDSEIKTYKCLRCAYEARQKGRLITHIMLVHDDPSKIKMYKCSFCAYEAKQKCNLKTHLLVHKDPSEIKMYKCSFCAYETKHKANLKTHLLVHEDPSEIKMFKCAHCAYEAKQKPSLKRHLLVHKDSSEIKTYKCSFCAYETKLKANLKTHMLVHKNPSETKMYKCSLSAHETKHKHNLKTHVS